MVRRPVRRESGPLDAVTKGRLPSWFPRKGAVTDEAVTAGVTAIARQQAFVLKKPEIQAAIAEGRKDQQERTEINADRVIREAWNVLTADARELAQVKVGCCRHCWGEGSPLQKTSVRDTCRPGIQGAVSMPGIHDPGC